MKTAVEWLVEELSLKSKALKIMLNAHKEIVEQAKAIEKEQKGYSEQDVIKIVEKSRKTGLTAEYLLLTFKQQEQ